MDSSQHNSEIKQEKSDSKISESDKKPPDVPPPCQTYPEYAKCGHCTPDKNQAWVWVKEIAVVVGVVIALIALCINAGQWRMQVHNFSADERAWIGAVDFGVASNTYAPNERIAFKTDVKNTGKTPAFINSIEYSFGTSTPPSNDIYWSFTTNLQGGALPPGGIEPIIMWEPVTNDFPSFAALESGRIVHHFRGIVRYSDPFSSNRVTEFCIPVCGTYQQLQSPFIPDYPGVMR